MTEDTPVEHPRREPGSTGQGGRRTDEWPQKGARGAEREGTVVGGHPSEMRFAETSSISRDREDGKGQSSEV